MKTRKMDVRKIFVAALSGALAGSALLVSLGGVSARAAGAETPVAPKMRGISLIGLIEEVSDTLGVELNASDVGHDSERVLELPVVKVAQLMDQFLSVLNLEGYALVPEPDGSGYQVLRQRDARDMEIPILLEQDKLPDNDQLITHLIRLQYFPPESMARALRSFAPATARIIPLEDVKAILVTDTARSMRKYRAIAQRLDEPKAAENSRALQKRLDSENPCPPANGRGSRHRPWGGALIALFALAGAIVGFLSRGYLIRRVEGGL